MTPPELFLASIGTCVGYYVVQFCNTRHMDTSDMRIEVDGEIFPDPGRIGRITVRIGLPFELDEEQTNALLRAATHCTIHNTLTHPPEVWFDVARQLLPVGVHGSGG